MTSGFRVGIIATLTENGDVSKLSAYMGNTTGGANQVFRGCIYSVSAGVPDAFMGVTPEVTIANGQANGWVDFTFSSSLALTAGDYWLGLWRGPNSNAADWYYTASANKGHYRAEAYHATNNPATPFGAETLFNQDASIYATYTASAAGLVWDKVVSQNYAHEPEHLMYGTRFYSGAGDRPADWTIVAAVVAGYDPVPALRATHL